METLVLVLRAFELTMQRCPPDLHCTWHHHHHHQQLSLHSHHCSNTRRAFSRVHTSPTDLDLSKSNHLVPCSQGYDWPSMVTIGLELPPRSCSQTPLPMYLIYLQVDAVENITSHHLQRDCKKPASFISKKLSFIKTEWRKSRRHLANSAWLSKMPIKALKASDK